jgi:surface protein
MFSGCTRLTMLDISGWNTAHVWYMNDMFANCSSLTTIYAGTGWTTAYVYGEWSERMFTNCTSLVGGMGTVFDMNHTDKSYARIDGGPANPGYFTEKGATLRGDVDGDETVSIDDVTTLLDYLLSGNASSIILEAADCDLDDDISINDVTALLDYLLKHSW